MAEFLITAAIAAAVLASALGGGEPKEVKTFGSVEAVQTTRAAD